MPPSNQRLGRAGACVAPTSLRRVKRLHDAGLIERQVAPPARQAGRRCGAGHGLTALLEVTLDQPGRLDAWTLSRPAPWPNPRCNSAGASTRARTLCWWCTPAICSAYRDLAQRLFTIGDANVRNVKAFSASNEQNFETKVPLPHKRGSQYEMTIYRHFASRPAIPP